MPVDPRVLEMLVCPACRDRVTPVDDQSGLECAGCGRIYPIQDEIPVMLVDRASEPTRKNPA